MSMFTAEYQDFKREDPTVLVKVTLYDDQKNVIKPAISKAKLVQGTKYAGDYEITQDGDQYCLSTKQVAKLPSGSYGMELWGDDGSIYPSAGFIPIRIHRNADNSLEQVDPTVDLNKIIEDMHNAGLNLVFDKIELLDSDQPGSITSSVHDGKNHITLRIPRGPKGDPGKPGHTPVRGVDYWTEADINAIKGDIYKGSKVIINKDQLVAPYDNLNTLPNNTVVTYAAGGSVKNVPQASLTNFTVYTFGAAGDFKMGSVQLLASQNDSLYWRASWNYGTNAYYGWQNLNQTVDNMIINNDDQLKSPYADLDTLPVNSTVTYAAPGTTNVKHLPSGLSTYNFTIDTKGYKKGNLTGAIQELITLDGDMYYRISWGWPTTFQGWHKAQQDIGQTNVLDYRAPSLSLFNNFAVVGDSYSAGSMQLSDGTWVDSQNNQWGLMLARKYGTNYTSLAKGGASTGTFLYDTLPKLKASDPQDIYYLILGINDSMDTSKTTGQKLGTPDDMHDDSSTNPGTFYGNYAKIIDEVKAKSPKAKIIMFTIMAHTEFRQEYNKAIKKIAEHYDLVVADVNQDPLFDSDYYISHMKGGHPTAPLYAAQSEALERVIQKTIVDNPEYFSDSAILKYE